MKNGQTYRINGFEQIKAFYSWVFNNAEKRITPQHISLYLFLINQGNRNNWVEWFKVPYDLGMTGACIGNKKTYYSCLADLSEWGMIKYEKGVNEWKAPLIKLEVLNSTPTDTATVPLPEPLPIPQVIPLPIPLPTHIYKLLTSNLKLITDNIEEVVNFLKDKNKEGENPKTWKTDFQIYLSECRAAYKKFMEDESFLKTQQRLNPNVNIKLSIEKGFTNYWSTEAGWKHKKKSRIAEIDWKATFINSIDINKVYYTKGETANQYTPPLKVLTPNSI